MGVPIIELPMLDLQLHKVYELTPGNCQHISTVSGRVHIGDVGPFGCNCAIVDPSLVVGASSATADQRKNGHV